MMGPETSTACIRWILLTAKITSIVVRKGVLLTAKKSLFTSKTIVILAVLWAKLDYVTFLAIRVQTPRKFPKCRYSLLSCLCDILCVREKRRNLESWGSSGGLLLLLLIYYIYNIVVGAKATAGVMKETLVGGVL